MDFDQHRPGRTLRGAAVYPLPGLIPAADDL